MLTYAIVSIGDKASQGKREDKSGKLIQQIMKPYKIFLKKYEIISDDFEIIQKTLIDFVDQQDIRLILTTGGTGFSQRDNTPEATKTVIEKEVPGFGEVMRVGGYQKTPLALLSRGMSGLRKKSLIINLPGSSKGVQESLELILPVLEHGLGILKENQEHGSL